MIEPADIVILGLTLFTHAVFAYYVIRVWGRRDDPIAPFPKQGARGRR